MKKYVIERSMAGVGALSREELHAASARSCRALEQVGPDVQWVHSYATGDRTYCIYLSESEDLIREHAERAGIPADRISEVRAMLDPAMGYAASAVAT